MDLHPPTEVLVRNFASFSSSSKILLDPATSSNSNSSIEGDISDADTNTSPLSSLCNSPCRMQVSIDDDDSDYNNNEGCKEVGINAVSFDAIRYSWMKRIDDVAVSRESRKSRIRASRTTRFTDEAVDNPDLKLPTSITPEKGDSSHKSNDVSEVSDEDRMDEKTSSDVKQGQNSFRYLNQKLQSLPYDDSCHSRNKNPPNDDLDNKEAKNSTHSRVRKRRIRYKYDTLDHTRTAAIESGSMKIDSNFLSKTNSKTSIKSLLQSQPAPCRLVIEETDIQCNHHADPTSAEEKDYAEENVEVFLSFQRDRPRAEAQHFINSSSEDRLHDSFLSLHLLRQQLDPSLDEEIRSISGLIDDDVARDTLSADEGIICSRANFDPQILANPFAIKRSDCDSNVVMNTMRHKVEVLDGGTPDISIDWGETFLFSESEEKKYAESTANHHTISLTPKEPEKQGDTHIMSGFAICGDELNIHPDKMVASTPSFNLQNQQRSCPIFDTGSPEKIEVSRLLDATPKDVFEPNALNGKIITSNGIKTSDNLRANSRISLAKKCGSELHKTTDQNNPKQNMKGLQCSSFPEDEACVGILEINEVASALPVAHERFLFRDNAQETILLSSANGSDTCPLTENFITRQSIISSDETSSLDGVTEDVYPQARYVCHYISDKRVMDEDVTRKGILSLSFPPYEITSVSCQKTQSFSEQPSSQPKTYSDMTQDEPPALKILTGSLKNYPIDLVESRFPMDEISTSNLPAETDTDVQYAQINVSGEIIAEAFEMVQPSSPMASFVASRCETSNQYIETEIQSTVLSGSTNDSTTLAFTGKTKSSAENMLNELEDMMKDLEETFDEIGTNCVENTTSKNSDEGKKPTKEVPLLVISIDNDIGIPKGDIMLSLLSSNENEGYDELIQDSVWPGKVKDAIWRCRTMRRNCDTKWLSSSIERDSPRHGQKRSIVVDVDDVRIVGGVDSIGETQASVLEYLNCDDFSDALVMYESILDIYNNYAVENECSEHSIFQHKVYVATTLHNIGIIHLLNGNFQEAFTFFERATMIRASSLGVKHSDHITSLVKMALCMFSLGDFPGAHSNLEYAANLGKDNLDNLADLCQFAEILNNIACLAFMCGEMRTTADRLQQCRALLNVLAGNSLYMGSKYSCHTISLNASICEANLALLAFGERDILTCVQGLESAVKNQHLLLRDAHPTLLTTMEHLVAANVAGGQHIKALQLLRRMLHIQIDTFGTDHKSCVETCKKIVYLEKEANHTTDLSSHQNRTTAVAPSSKNFESFERK